jgi:N-acetylglutamate synthase-like GNAT family acetyltransferase
MRLRGRVKRIFVGVRKVFEIRKFEDSDSGEISKLIENTILKVCKNDYTELEARKMINLYSSENIKKNITDDEIFLLVNDNSIIGVFFFNLHQSQIKGIYLKYDEVGKGLGKKLLEKIEQLAKSNDLSKIWLMPTSGSRKFYTKNYFESQTAEVYGIESKIMVKEL